MHQLRPLLGKLRLGSIAFVAAMLMLSPRIAHAEAHLLIEADTGKVLEAENATVPWYPASVTKIMTAYVTLKAVEDGKVTLDTLLTVSPRAASQSPSKMGLKPGTQLTVDNALKMMLVRSANDMAVVLAEGVGGSVDNFAEMMNEAAQQLGMTQTHYVNPNGLPDDGQITSARDLGILARSFLRDLPQYEYFVHIPAIRFGHRVTQNFNRLIGRYPGADGFKTGFICAAGYNLVASATRNGRRLIAVVLGASSNQMRAVRAAQLLDRGFASSPMSWLRPSLGSVESLVPLENASPPDLRDEICNGKRHKPASDEEDTVAGGTGSADSNPMSYAIGLAPPTGNAAAELASDPQPAEPVIVYTGPTRTGAALLATVEADERADVERAKAHAKKTRVSVKIKVKPDAEEATTTGKSGVKPHPGKAEQKAGGVKHAAAATPEPAARSTSGDASGAVKQAKPKPVAAKPRSVPKAPASEAKPAG